MDALRKAEEAKRLASEPAAPDHGPGELTLAPLSTPASPLPNLAQHSAVLDAELSAAARQGPAEQHRAAAAVREQQASERETAKRSAVRNAFAAKAPPPSRRALWLVLALAAVIAIGLGAYFWWQLQTLSKGSPPVLAPSPAPAQRQAPAPATPAALPTAPAAPGAEQQPATNAPSAMAPPQPSAAADASARLEPLARPSRPSPPARTSPASPLRLSKSAAQPPLERAYDGLQAGRLDEAQRDYEQVLRSDAKNTDALLGLATIAARQGQSELAQGYYLRALESDPNDATAQAGLLNTRGQADPGLSESRLKSALAGQPQSSALHFALGNLYARQSRWSEAQQAYFRAYSGEPDNADFIFNLAVSLDHLHQNRLAAQYYQMALASTGVALGSFDRKQVSQRILELQP